MPWICRFFFWQPGAWKEPVNSLETLYLGLKTTRIYSFTLNRGLIIWARIALTNTAEVSFFLWSSIVYMVSREERKKKQLIIYKPTSASRCIMQRSFLNLMCCCMKNMSCNLLNPFEGFRNRSGRVKEKKRNRSADSKHPLRLQQAVRLCGMLPCLLLISDYGLDFRRVAYI